MRIAALILLATAIGCSAVPEGAYGEVYDLSTHQPIQGAQLTVHRVGKGRTEVAPLSLSSDENGLFAIEKVKEAKVSHVMAEAGGYYPGVGVRRGRIYLRPVPKGARPVRSIAYEVDMETEDVGLQLATGAVVPAEQADVIVRVQPPKGILRRAVLVRAKGGVRRVVSRMSHGVGLEPFAAFDNIVEVPKKGYTRRRSRGTSSYGWTTYGTYAVRTRDRQRHAKIIVAAFPDELGERAQVVIRYGLSEPGESRFVATTP